jgi:DNA polymerase-3 subunit alpha
MAAVISSVMDTKDKVPFFVAQAEQMGIKILPPDVNLSDHRFVVVDGNIRFGLDAVKGVGFAAVEAIKQARGDFDNEMRPFTDIFDFCERIDSRAVNKKAIEALIKCGAFGSTGATRQGMLAVLEQAQSAGSKAQQDAQIGQASIFDLFDNAGDGAAPVSGRPSHVPIPTTEFDKAELLAFEKESVGLFISEHPLKDVAAAMSVKTDYSLGELGAAPDQDRVVVGGILSMVKKLRTKKGDPMMFATLEDLTGSVELVIFSDTIDECAEAIEKDSVVLVKGNVDQKEGGQRSIVARSVIRFAPSAREMASAEQQVAKLPIAHNVFRLRLDATVLPPTAIGDLREVLGNFPGESDVVVELHTSGGPRQLKLGNDFRVSRSAGLHAELEARFGAAILAPEVAAKPAVA